MPRYRSKYPNRMKDYRGFIDWLEIATPITEYLQLKRIPHFTSLQKAAARLDRMEHASRYYQTRLTYRGKERDIRRKHLKSTISADTKTLLIIAVRHRQGPASDHKDFHLVARSTHRLARPDVYVADKGYDAEPHHQLIQDELKALSIIPARNEDAPARRTKGKYRKEMKRGYDRKIHNRRVLVETVNSVVKRRFGECIYSRKVRTQNRELKLRYLAYNADRYVKLLLFISMRISTKHSRG